jgi:hypothetical protein
MLLLELESFQLHALISSRVIIIINFFLSLYYVLIF